MSDLAWLTERGFKHVGDWTHSYAKLRRSFPIKASCGIYAFVVNDIIVYIGKATRLRSRLRQYNRAFGPETARGFRKVHLGLKEQLESQKTVDVWVYYHNKPEAVRLCVQETTWIREKDPSWNNSPLRVISKRTRTTGEWSSAATEIQPTPPGS